jgi:predicted phage terminase large subunit-like protein
MLPAGWRNNPEAAAAVLTMMQQRKRALNPPPKFDTPGDLAKALNPATVQTAALDLIDAALMRVARGECNRLIISMPPQEGKSQRTTHYGILWFLKQNPELRVAIVSYSDRIARRFSLEIRNDLQAFDGRYGALDLELGLKKDAKSTQFWQLAHPHAGSVYATGIGGAFSGTPVDLLVIDDPVKDYRAAESVIQSEAAWDWWSSVARARVSAKPVILILTRWHELDLAGRLLTQQAEDEKKGLEHFDRWEVVNIPAQADHNPEADETDPLDRRPGEFMQSARGRSTAEWEATKAATPARTWSAMFQGRPSPDAGDVWKREWWRFYDRPLWSISNPGTNEATYTVDDFDDMIMSWDMTFKDANDSDFVVGGVWMRRGALVYKLDQVRARLSFTETVTAFERMVQKWPQVRAKLVEDKANGTAVMDTLRKKIPGLIPINPKESKYARASAVSPFIQAGGVYLPSSEVALFPVDEFIDEAAQFPNGAHDDQVDESSQALARFFIGAIGAAEWIAAMQKKQAETEQADAELTHVEPTGDPLRDARNAAFRAVKR